MGEERTSFPRFRRVGTAPRIALTDDDVEILRRVFRYRFVRADDLYRLFDQRSPDKISRRLVRLYRNHYLDRPIAQVDRYREGGSKAMVYGLDNAGARFIAETLGVSVPSGEWKSRNRSYTRENLDHTLSTTKFLIDLEIACRSRADVEFLPFEEIVETAPEATRRLPRPGRWSVQVRWGDASGDVLLIPDAIFGLRLTQPDGRKIRSFVFLEIDRGTMTIVPSKHVHESSAFLHRSSILRKLLTYATSHHLQLHKEHLGLPVARVLFLTPSAARADAMRQAASSFVIKPMRLAPGLLLFGTLADAATPLNTRWFDADNQPTQLVPERLS